jgi:type I restriction enzyme S subunit
MKTNQLQKNNSNDWQEKTLGDFLEKLEGGGTPSKENSDYWNGSIPWASVKDVVTHNPKDTQDHITELGLENSSSRLVKKGTLIVPTRMALGHAVVFDVDVAINQDLKALYPKKDLLNQYLFHWFKSNKEFIERLGSGSTVSGIQQDELKRIKFNLPSLPEQNRIVSVLETWDRSIEKLTQKIEAKKQVKKGLTDKFVYHAKNTTEYFIDDLFELGRGRVIARGEIEKNPGVYPVYSSQTSNDGIFGSIDTFDFDGEYLTWTTDGANAGRVFYRTGKFNCTNVCGTAKLKENLKVNLYFVYSYLNYVTKNYVSYVGNPKLMNGVFGKIQIKIPEINEQNKIAEVLKLSDKEIRELEKKLQIINEQKKYLLNNLITGTIRTPEILSAKLTK